MKNLTTLVLVSFMILAVTHCFPIKPKHFPYSATTSKSSFQETGLESYQVKYFDQKISHYNFKITGTFKQKYLIDTSNWDQNKKSPILFYCGNEGPIEMFYKNTGFYNDVVSKQFKSILVYPQHRYFGQSMPFGDQKTSYQKENLVYLTTEQALMDYVQFIKYLKATYCPTCPVIAFGGSYGGMLAAWIRMKYPHVVDMAHAASAPIYYYKNRDKFDLGIFSKIVSKNYYLNSDKCPNTIRNAFKLLTSYSKNPSAPIGQISAYFNLCTPLKNYQDIPLLMQYINDGYSYLAMLNYPYPTSFLKNLTAWPANSSCLAFDNLPDTPTEQQLFTAIQKSVGYYYHFNSTKCNEIYQDSTADQDMSGWNILACGDQAMPMTSDGKQDIFYPQAFDYDAYTKQCQDSFGIQPDYEYTLNHFGGVTDDQYKYSSKIVFTNGQLDPWSGASPKKSLSDTLVSCVIPKGAHHLDLRSPNPADPQEAINCRNFVLNKFAEWLPKAQQQNSFSFNKDIRISKQ